MGAKLVASGKEFVVCLATFSLSILFIGLGGLTKLIGAQFQKESFSHYGYPIWMMYLVGATELACGGMILVKRTRFVSAIIMILITIGVVVSMARAGELTWRVFGSPAVVTMAVAGSVAWLSRPQQRRRGRD